MQPPNSNSAALLAALRKQRRRALGITACAEATAVRLIHRAQEQNRLVWNYERQIEEITGKPLKRRSW